MSEQLFSFVGMDASMFWFMDEVFSRTYQDTLNEILDIHGQENAGEVKSHVEKTHMVVSVNYGSYCITWSTPLYWNNIHLACAMARMEQKPIPYDRLDELIRIATNE